MMISGVSAAVASAGAVRGSFCRHLLPPHVAPLDPRHVAALAANDHHVAHGRRGVRGLVRGLLHAHDVAAALEAIGRDEDLRLAVLESRGHGLGAVAGEARRVDRADAGHGQGGDHRFRTHGQEDAHAVAGAHAEAAEPVGHARRLARQLRVRQGPRLAGVALPHQRGLGATTGLEVPVEAVHGEVELAALEPARPGDAARGVEHPAKWLRPPQGELVAHRSPVPLGILDRSALKLGERCRRRRAS